MRPLLVSHPVFRAHRPPPGHPERPERLDAVLRGLAPLAFTPHAAPAAADDAILRAHTPELLAHLQSAAAEARREGFAALDPDTYLSPDSFEAARRAAGGALSAVEQVLAGGAPGAFCVLRPPGHHAEPDRAMGFCLLNSIAIAALHALDALGCPRVAVLDLDVHHGNGTQSVAEREPRLLFASVHQAPLYPGTGDPSEHGPHGNVRNITLPPGAAGPAWRPAVAQALAWLAAGEPALLLVSLGFDGHARDPLANWALHDADFAWAGRHLRTACAAPVVALLEGGYDLSALESASRAFASGLWNALEEEDGMGGGEQA